MANMDIVECGFEDEERKRGIVRLQRNVVVLSVQQRTRAERVKDSLVYVLETALGICQCC